MTFETLPLRPQKKDFKIRGALAAMLLYIGCSLVYTLCAAVCGHCYMKNIKTFKKEKTPTFHECEL